MGSQGKELFFDSVNFTILDVRRNILENVLKPYGLNLTKYCVVLKCLEMDPDALSIREVAAAIHTQANVVTQAVNDLERMGWARRVTSPADARVKLLRLEPKAAALPSEVEKELQVQMGAVFNPEGDPKRRALLYESTKYSGRIGDIWTEPFVARFPLSASVTAVSVFVRDVRSDLKEKIGLPLTECRILQVIAEEGEPQRPVDLAAKLRISTAAIVSSAGNMVADEILCRLSDPGNKKEVYFSLTEKGMALRDALFAELEELSKNYWGALSHEDQELSLVIRSSFAQYLDMQRQQERSIRMSSLVTSSS